MKILFIYPNAGSQVGFNYGLAHISAILKQAGHEVRCIQVCEDLAPLPEADQFISDVQAFGPDLVGFSVVTTQWEAAKELAGWVKQAVDCPICCGGIHATVAGEEILASGLFDYVFQGECDDIFPQFVDLLAGGQDVSSLSNLGFIRDGEIVINPVGPLPDLGALPPKDFEIFDFQKLIDAKDGWVGLMASRGCPFSCTYCFNHFIVGKYRNDLKCSFKDLNYVRHFDVGAVVDEIKYLLASYNNINMFIFDDDLFTFDGDYVEEFCRAYKAVTDIPFVANAHVGFFDERRARALASAGCKIVKFGVESGSENIRGKIMNRHMSNQAIVDAMQLSRQFGLHSSAFIMIGLPYETREDLYETIDLLSVSQPGRFRWTYFYPFPSTRSCELAEEGGFLNRSRMEGMTNFTDASCLDFAPEQNLLLEKVGRIMPWFVNARADRPGAEVYREEVDKLLAMDADQWASSTADLIARDKELSAAMQKNGASHYAVKYNRFMGVSSDYFLNED